VIGNTGILSLIFFLELNFREFYSLLIKKVFILLCSSAFFLSTYAFLLALLLNGDSPFNLFKILTSLVCYICVGGVLYLLCNRVSTREKSCNEFIIWFFKMTLFIVVLNSLIIIYLSIKYCNKNHVKKLFAVCI